MECLHDGSERHVGAWRRGYMMTSCHMRLFLLCPCVHASCCLRQSYRPTLIILSIERTLFSSPRLASSRVVSRWLLTSRGCLEATASPVISSWRPSHQTCSPHWGHTPSGVSNGLQGLQVAHPAAQEASGSVTTTWSSTPARSATRLFL